MAPRVTTAGGRDRDALAVTTMYYECTNCGHLDRFGYLEPDETYRTCPSCEDRTRWELAFEGEGMSP